MVSGSDAFICEHCVLRWALEIGQSGPGRPLHIVLSGGDLIRPTGPPPENQDAAWAQMSVAFSSMGAVSGKTLTMVEGGDQLLRARNAAIERHGSFSSLAFTIDGVAFIDADHAAVWFTSSNDVIPMFSRHRGEAVVVDGTWKVSRATFLELMRLAGVEDPPVTE